MADNVEDGDAAREREREREREGLLVRYVSAFVREYS
jgi:hypothetical protein